MFAGVTRVPLPPLFRGQNKTPRNTLFINGSTVSTGYCATSKRGKGGGASHQRGGMHFQRPPGRLYGFCRQRRHLYWRPQGRTPRQRSGTIYLPRAEARSPSGRRQPVPDRTLGAQGQRPGGAVNPRPRKTTVGRLNGRPFYGQAKGQLRPTCTSYAGCAHQPSGIRFSGQRIADDGQPTADSCHRLLTCPPCCTFRPSFS